MYYSPQHLHEQQMLIQQQQQQLQQQQPQQQQLQQQQPQQPPQQQQMFQYQQQQQQQQQEQDQQQQQQQPQSQQPPAIRVDSSASGSNGADYVMFERHPEQFSAATQEKANAVKAKIEHFFQVNVVHAVERNQRRVCWAEPCPRTWLWGVRIELLHL